MIFEGISAVCLAELNIGGSLVGAFDLDAPAWKALIRRHESIFGVLFRLVDTIIYKSSGMAVGQLSPFSVDDFRVPPEWGP